MLAGKSAVRAGNEVVQERHDFLIMPNPLTNLKIQRYYQNEPKRKGVYLRSNLPSIAKCDAYAVNLDEYKSVGTHWIVCER